MKLRMKLKVHYVPANTEIGVDHGHAFRDKARAMKEADNPVLWHGYDPRNDPDKYITEWRRQPKEMYTYDLWFVVLEKEPESNEYGEISL